MFLLYLSYFLLLSKIRGALNAAKNCEKTDPVLVTHSSGNHAQAVAMAAKLCQQKAHVVVPFTTPQVKKEAVLGLGAEITGCINTESVRFLTWLTVFVHN